MKLIKPSDDALNAAFAEKVVGWTQRYFDYCDETGDKGMMYYDSAGNTMGFVENFNEWTQSADAVLPWLERAKLWECGYSAHHDGYWVTVGHGHESEAPTFPRAAVIALLRAHGVEVEL